MAHRLGLLQGTQHAMPAGMSSKNVRMADVVVKTSFQLCLCLRESALNKDDAWEKDSVMH